MPGSQATQAVVEELHRAAPEPKPLLLLAVADRGDDNGVGFQAILEAAKSGSKNLRLVAVGVLDRMGKVSSVPVLLDVAAENDAELSQSALVALTRMPGNELDAKLLEHLGKRHRKDTPGPDRACSAPSH